MTVLSDVWFKERDEAAEFHQATVGADFDLIKFDAGPLSLGMKWIVLPDLLIVWATARGHARWIAQHSNGCPNFFFAFGREHQFWGRDLSPGLAVFGNASGIREGSFSDGCTTLDVTVSLELTERLGWTVGPDDMRAVAAEALDNLRNVCRLATERSDYLTRMGSETWPPGEADHWQGLILDALETAARPWLSQPPGQSTGAETFASHHRMVRQAEDLLRALPVADRRSVADLADDLGVPVRTLYSGFRRSLGVGPRRYLELLRLYAFRSRLLAADPQSDRVLDIAHELGASEFGRLAGRYRDQFGELPSETLRRAPV